MKRFFDSSLIYAFGEQPLLIQVTVHLHTILRRQTPEGLISRMDVTLPEGSTLADLIKELGIELSPDDLLLVVNQRTAEPERVLQDGDNVNLIPSISGG